MAQPTHYETLGLRPGATDKEIKAAYRRVVLRHHPDRSSDPASTRIFMAATSAYEVLNDPQERRRYDAGLAAEAQRKAEREREVKREKEASQRVRAARAASTEPRPQAPSGTPPRGGVAISTQVARLSMLFSRGLYAEAEKLADEIVRRDPRQPLPYAILGDLARQRGHMSEAARHYSLAIQMDPSNATYVRRYEEVLTRATPAGGATPMESSERLTLSILLLGLIVASAAVFLALSPERAAFDGLGPIATWTVGLVAMLFLGGLATGACLSAGGGLDRLEAYASGRLGPTVALGTVAVFSFPVAILLYAALGAAQRGFNVTTTRLMGGVGVVVVVLTVASALAHTGIDPASVLLFGGNLGYLGALCGWAVADSLRGP